MGTEKMGWEQFKEGMLQAVMERTGIKPEAREALKNNGKKMHGICFRTGSNVMPVLYLESYYQYYQTHGWQETVDAVVRDYEENRVTADIDIRFFTEYGRIREKLSLRLINYAMNRELLEGVPHRRYLDFAVVLHVLIGTEKSGAASILVNDSHLKIWDVGEDEVFREAEKNMRGSCEICSMSDIINDMTGIDMEETGQMYVASNRIKLYGASVLLLKDMLEQFAAEQQAEEVVILPSSVHEVIFLPQTVKTGEEEISSLREMVRTVNREQLRTEEILSDNIYVYDTESKSINIR